MENELVTVTDIPLYRVNNLCNTVDEAEDMGGDNLEDKSTDKATDAESQLGNEASTSSSSDHKEHLPSVPVSV